MAQKRDEGRESELEEPKGQRKRRDLELYEAPASSFPRAPLDGSTTLCSIHGSPGFVSVVKAVSHLQIIKEEIFPAGSTGEEQQANV